MDNKEATASLLFAAAILIALWLAGTAMLFFDIRDSLMEESIPLATQIGYCIVLSLLAVALSCSLAESSRKYCVRTFSILGACSLLVFLSMNAGLGIVW
jgi:hypothetical protein